MGNACCATRETTPENLTLNIHPYQKKGHRILFDDKEEVYEAVLSAVKVAEDRKKAPVYVLDIFKCLKPPHDL